MSTLSPEEVARIALHAHMQKEAEKAHEKIAEQRVKLLENLRRTIDIGIVDGHVDYDFMQQIFAMYEDIVNKIRIYASGNMLPDLTSIELPRRVIYEVYLAYEDYSGNNVSVTSIIVHVELFDAVLYAYQYVEKYHKPLIKSLREFTVKMKGA